MGDGNYDELKRMAVGLGADLFGVAEKSRLEEYIDDEIKAATAKMSYIISLGIRLQKAVLDTLVDGPNQLYKTHYRQANVDLDHASHRLATHIQNRGFAAMPIAASFTLDWQRQTAHISHRHVAYEAGLGFRGRNNLLVHPRYGAAVRLSSILTDMPLTPDNPLPDDCGDCVACIVACPADAIGADAFNFDKCYAQIKKFARENNCNLNICGLCIKACGDARL